METFILQNLIKIILFFSPFIVMYVLRLSNKFRKYEDKLSLKEQASAISFFSSAICLSLLKSTITNVDGYVNFTTTKKTTNYANAPPVESIKIIEKSLLATILTNKNKAELEDINLSVGDFYDSKCKIIYKAIVDVCFKDENEIDEALIIANLQSSDDFKNDWVLELAELVEPTPPSFNCVRLADKIKEASIYRQRLSLVDAFKSGKISETDLIDKFEELSQIETDDAENQLISMSGHNLDEIKPNEIDVFGVKIQYSAIFILTAATSTGKTEFLAEIADVHAREKDRISLFYQYEGTAKDMIIRFESKKHISNKNLYVRISPSFKEIKKDVARFKDKKIFIVIDYLQMFARRLQSQDAHASERLMFYTNKIYQFLNDLRNKSENVCICLLSSFSNQGIRENNGNNDKDPLTMLTAVKEDGNIVYDCDYGYGLLFSDDKEKLFLSRYDINAKSRKYTHLAPIKPSRIGFEIEPKTYIYDGETGRYNLVDKKFKKNKPKPLGRPRGKNLTNDNEEDNLL